MKRFLVLASGMLALAATGCSTCPNPYDNTGPVVNQGYPAGSYSTQPQPVYGAQPQPVYGQPQAMYPAQPQPMVATPQPGYTPLVATPSNNGGGQPTPANTARLAPVETPASTTTR